MRSAIAHLLARTLAAAFLLSPALAQQPTIEPSTDRYGSDYSGTVMPTADPELCRASCAQDTRCKAYTYVKPGVQGPEARCYLKDPAPAATANECCVSGVKAPLTLGKRLKPSTTDSPIAKKRDSTVILPPVAEGPSVVDRIDRNSAILDRNSSVAGVVNSTVPPGLRKKAAANAAFGPRNALGRGWPIESGAPAPARHCPTASARRSNLCRSNVSSSGIIRSSAFAGKTSAVSLLNAVGSSRRPR